MKSKIFILFLIVALSVPAMAVDLNGTWYTGSKYGDPYLSTTTDNTFIWGDATATGTNKTGALWSYFTDLTLSQPGDKITLEFSADVNNTITDPLRDLRFGLFNDGGTRVLNNIGPSNTDAAFSDTTGYLTRWSTAPAGSSWLYARIPGYTFPCSTLGGAQSLTSAYSNPGISDSATNHFTFTVIYLNENEYQVTSTHDNGTASKTLSGTRTITVDDPATFNTFAMLNPPTGIESLTLIGVKAIYNDWASNPYPAHGAIDVELNPVLSWDTGKDPNVPSQVNANITKHLLYGNFVDPTDPNLFFIAEMPVGTTTYDITTLLPGGLQLDGSYQWRVDEYTVDPVTSDPCTITGMVWNFDTILSTPGIDLQPEDLTVDENEEAILLIEASNPFTGDATGLSYQWKYSPDGVTYTDVTGGNSSALVIPAAQTSDQGYYYCDVTIASNSQTISSEVAQLIVKQTLAHWTMDQADFVGGQYVDIVAGHNADANSTPIFVAGAGPDMPADGAALIAPDSHGTVGTWNPVETTGQVTLSTWIKWDGSDLGTYGKDIIMKQDSWGTDTMMWSFRLRDIAANGNGGIRFYNNSGMSVISGGVIPVDTWTHVCAVYGSGQAQLYINGRLSKTDGNAALGTGTQSQLVIGGNAKFPGALDNVMIHNYAMPAEDVAALYYETSQEDVCLYPPEMDLSGDCEVDLEDFAIFAETWAKCGLVPDCLN